MHRRRRARAMAGGLLAVVLLGVPAPDAGAAGGVGAIRADSITDHKSSVDQQIADLREALEGASQDLVDAAVALQRSQAQLAQQRALLAAAERSRAAPARRDDELAGRLAFAEAELAEAERDMQDEQATEAATRVSLGRLARDTYVGSGLSGLSVALQATSPEEFTERLAVAGVALRAQGGAIARLSVVQADLRARSTRLDAVRARIAGLKGQSEVVVAQRRAAEDSARAATGQIADLVARGKAEMATIDGKIAAERQRLAGLEAEQATLQAMLAARARSAADEARRRHSGDGWNPPASSGFLSYPAPGEITSGFGMRYHPILHIYRMHTGVDWGVPCGTPVHAAADGDVVSAGWAGGYGNRVVIDHGEVRGGDLATTYNHLTSIAVGGGRVSRGQVIGYSGTTGLSTGCHLHFETLLDGRYVNPMGYL